MASRYAAFCTNTIPICGSSYTNRTHSARPHTITAERQILHTQKLRVFSLFDKIVALRISKPIGVEHNQKCALCMKIVSSRCLQHSTYIFTWEWGKAAEAHWHTFNRTQIYMVYIAADENMKKQKKKRKALEGRGSSSSSSNSGGIGRADETNVRRPDVRLARTTERNPRCRIHSIISVWIVHVHTLARCVPCHTADVSPPSPMSAIVHVCDRTAANGGSSECMHSAQNGIIHAQPECDRPRLHT